MRTLARLLVTLSFLGAGAVVAAAPARALTACGERGPILTALAQKYEEARRAYGLMGQSGLVELYVSRAGTWTVVVSSPGGRACIVAAGHSWEMLPLPLPGKGAGLRLPRP